MIGVGAFIKVIVLLQLWGLSRKERQSDLLLCCTLDISAEVSGYKCTIRKKSHFASSAGV